MRTLIVDKRLFSFLFLIGGKGTSSQGKAAKKELTRGIRKKKAYGRMERWLSSANSYGNCNGRKKIVFRQLLPLTFESPSPRSCVFIMLSISLSARHAFIPPFPFLFIHIPRPVPLQFCPYPIVLLSKDQIYPIPMAGPRHHCSPAGYCVFRTKFNLASLIMLVPMLSGMQVGQDGLMV